MFRIYITLIVIAALPVCKAQPQSVYFFDINNIKMPIHSFGILADIYVNPYGFGGWYDGKKFIYSGGFYMSGKDGADLWAFAQASSSRNEHTIQGPVDKTYPDSLRGIYIVSSKDVPFGSSWQYWSYAVDQGAKFIDGDGDGLYTPVDKNNNGVWDSNEDKPEILGDITTFCVYNDGRDPNSRNGGFDNQLPKGIEIRQTIYGFKSSQPELANSLFIRYELMNTGVIAPVFDSVYFSFFADGDLGDYSDDMVGCDTLLNAGYTYNFGDDTEYGGDPPAFFIALYNHLPAVGRADTTEEVMNSFMHCIAGDYTLSDPFNPREARYYQLALSRFGERIDPCTWDYGTVFVDSCEDVNPLYLYSGNPVENTGWLLINADDHRMMINSGPFTLKQDAPVELYGSYTVGQGTDALNSVVVGRSYIESLKSPDFIVGVNEQITGIPSDFRLSQNYPNPFNPVTTINYQLPVSGKVSLKVYNVLGQKVKTLVNEVQEAGYKTVEFDGSKLASGVYIYRIGLKTTGRSEYFSESRKMILLK